MKMGKFRRVAFTMERTHMYGHYYIFATYKGKKIKVLTTDSETWDFLDDESDKERHQDARRACYYAIARAYNELY